MLEKVKTLIIKLGEIGAIRKENLSPINGVTTGPRKITFQTGSGALCHSLLVSCKCIKRQVYKNCRQQ